MARSGGSRTRARGGWLLGHRRAAREGYAHIRGNVVAAMLSIAVMAVAVGLPATLFALLENQRVLVSEWGGEPTLSLFLTKETSAEAAQALATELRGIVQIGAIEFVSSDTAFAEFSGAVGVQGDMADEPNPLPHVLIVTLLRNHPGGDGDEALVAKLRENGQIEAVLVDSAWLDRLSAISALATRGLWVLALLLLGATVLIIGNTIRTLVVERVAEIEVLKLVGATDAYVRRPFLYGGTWHGIAAGVLAVVLIEIVFLALAGPISRVATVYLSPFTLVGPSFGFVGAVVLLSGFTGWCGAWLGTVHSLRRFAPRD
jgi:cell division transport system permease protein